MVNRKHGDGYGTTEGNLKNSLFVVNVSANFIRPPPRSPGRRRSLHRLVGRIFVISAINLKTATPIARTGRESNAMSLPSMKWNCNGCDFHGYKCLAPNKDCENDGVTPLVWAEINPPNAKDHRAGRTDPRRAQMTINPGSGASSCWAGPGQQVQP